MRLLFPGPPQRPSDRPQHGRLLFAEVAVPAAAADAKDAKSEGKEDGKASAGSSGRPRDRQSALIAANGNCVACWSLPTAAGAAGAPQLLWHRSFPGGGVVRELKQLRRPGQEPLLLVRLTGGQMALVDM